MAKHGRALELMYETANARTPHYTFGSLRVRDQNRQCLELLYETANAVIPYSNFDSLWERL